MSVIAGQATVYIAWRYVGDFASEWWIDDVHIFEPEPLIVDVVAQSPDSNQSLGNSGDYIFRITNTGTSADTYDLTGSGLYFDSLSTSTTAMLAAGAFEDVRYRHC